MDKFDIIDILQSASTMLNMTAADLVHESENVVIDDMYQSVHSSNLVSYYLGGRAVCEMLVCSTGDLSFKTFWDEDDYHKHSHRNRELNRTHRSLLNSSVFESLTSIETHIDESTLDSITDLTLSSPPAAEGKAKTPFSSVYFWSKGSKNYYEMCKK